MKKVKSKRMLLRKIVKTFFVITLFSVIVFVPGAIESAEFKFSEFDWPKFSEEHKNYWDDLCANESENETETNECIKRILKKQKKFYEKMYRLLVKANKKTTSSGDPNDDMEAGKADNYIIETVFFNLSPSQLGTDEDNGTNEEYMEEYSGKKDGIAIDGDDEFEIGDDINDASEELAEYYKQETDTLKLLISNLTGYNTYCYKSYGAPTTTKAQDGSESKSCPNGGEIVELKWNQGGEKCVDQLGAWELGQYVYHQSWLLHGKGIGLDRIKGILYLGTSHKDEHYDECHDNTAGENEEIIYYYDRQIHFLPERYFDFLKENKYFDGKPHLQSYFEETILKPAEVECMLSTVCDNSLEAKGLYDTYDQDIIDVRMSIIFDIINILRDYGMNVSYEGDTSHEGVKEIFDNQVRQTYYWPIGSDETETRDGVLYADGAPSSTEVNSYFGERTNSVTGEQEMNYGIDISGIEGVTNVVAVDSGEVLSVVSNCTKGDYDCNDGYGNTITISHPNGDYTVYAHLSQVSVTTGTQVAKGQVLGKVGSTGRTNEAVLHYELRIGGNSVENAVNPLNTISASNPRPTYSSGSGANFSVHSTSLTREEFIAKVQNYCNSGHCVGAHAPFKSIFADNAGSVYDWSIKYNVNPELVVVRALGEASFNCGPNNHWGLGCYNGYKCSQCLSYSSLEAGIKGFADNVRGYNSALDMMMKYAYIGAYWYNPGDWGLGGCPYYPYIKGYMSSSRASQISPYCSSGSCSEGGSGNCLQTNQEDQEAYASWQVEKYMGTFRHNVFGL